MGGRKSLVDRTLGGLAWTFMGAGGQAVVNALVLVALARLIAPAEFGLVSAALVVVNLAQVFTQLGVGPALVQLETVTRQHVRVGFGIAIAIGSVLAVIIAAASGPISSFFRMPELASVVVALASVFPILGAASVGRALLQRELHFRQLTIIDFSSYIIGYGLVGIVFALYDAGVWALVAAQLGHTMLSTLLLLYVQRDRLGFAYSRTEAHHLLSFGAGFSLARIANYLANQADNLVVGRYLGADALGIYGRAYQFFMLPANLVGTITRCMVQSRCLTN